MKLAFLGLKTLTIMDKACRLIEEDTGVELDLTKIPLDDQKTFELLQSGRTPGIFQLESGGMSNLLVRLRPDTFEDIIALLALHRPGPLNSGMVETYVRRKHGLEEVECLHDSLSEILEETYGVIVYQEQVMRIAHILAGFSLNDADSLRKAMGKKDPKVMAKFRNMFVEGAGRKGVTVEQAGDIYDKIEFFAGYGFNKSHATAYGVITYQTADLKANHPIPFMASVMSCDASNTDRIAEYRLECKQMGIEVLGPDINKSDHDFTACDSAIRFGLSAIKGIGEKTIEGIIASRGEGGAFRSLPDLLLRVDLKTVNKTVGEALIKAGAFDSTGATRATCAKALDGLLRWAAGVQADRKAGQRGLFGSSDREGANVRLPEVEEWDEDRKLQGEKDVLGFIISSDPTLKYAHLMKFLAPVDARNAKEMADGAKICVGGILSNLRILLSKSGKNIGKKMALFKIRTSSGHLSGVVFSKEYGKYKDWIEDDRFLLFTGLLDHSRADPVPSLKVTELCTVDEAIRNRCESLIVRVGGVTVVTEQLVRDIRAVAEEYPGKGDLYLHITGPERRGYTVHAGDRYRIEMGEEIVLALEALVGRGNVELR